MKWGMMSEELLLESFAKTQEEAQAWFDSVRCYPTRWSVANGAVDCESFKMYGLTDVHSLGVKFGDVSGDFEVRHNGLTTLKGFPKSVGGSYKIGGSDVKSLRGGPVKVDLEFGVIGTGLTDLSGAPTSVGTMTIRHNPGLTSLKGGPRSVSGDVTVVENKSLKSFDGFPSSIGGTLSLVVEYDNNNQPLSTSLKGIHKHVKKCKKIVIGGVTSDVVGLTQIEGLEEIEIVSVRNMKTTSDVEQHRAIEIVRKYLGGPDAKRARDCQAELIYADLDDYASM